MKNEIESNKNYEIKMTTDNVIHGKGLKGKNIP